MVNIYDAVTFVLRQSLCAPETVTKIKNSADGSILFFAHSFSVTMWDVQTGGLTYTFTTQSKINDITVSTSYIACGLSDGSVVFWNIHTKEECKGFGNGQPIVTIYWSSPQELAVATQWTLYIHSIIVGETLSSFSVPGHVWGMVYLEDKNEFLIGFRVGQETSHFIQCKQHKLTPRELKLLRWKFTNIKWSPPHSGQLLSPILVGNDIACITPESGVQLFNIESNQWANNPPLLGAATSMTVSLNRNIIVQANDSIQIFSMDVLKSCGGDTHSSLELQSGHDFHTITKGEPAPPPATWQTPPYTLDANCEWVLDAESRRVCWISPGNLQRGDGGHFWVDLSLVMVGDNGVVRKLTFKDPDY